MAWPPLAVDDWTETRETLHRWVQVVGKVRLALAPEREPLVARRAGTSTATGLTTTLIPVGRRGLEVQFDFVDHRLLIDTTDGRRRTVELAPRTDGGLPRRGDGRARRPRRRGDDPPRPRRGRRTRLLSREDRHHASVRPRRGPPVLAISSSRAHRVLSRFRGRVPRQGAAPSTSSGARSTSRRPASPGAPPPATRAGSSNCPDWVMWEAYCAEVSSCGFWPGGSEEGSFYSLRLSGAARLPGDGRPARRRPLRPGLGRVPAALRSGAPRRRPRRRRPRLPAGDALLGGAARRLARDADLTGGSGLRQGRRA